MMECRQASELLPWFANGSLEPAEAEAVAGHLGECEACRRELSETGAAFEIFGEHLPIETLVGMAFDGVSDPVSRLAAESHLEGCSACLEQLALVRRSRRALAEVEDEDAASAGAPDLATFPAGGRRTSPASWRGMALAASITALVTTAGWIWTWQGSAGPRGPAATFRGGAEPSPSAGAEGPWLNVPVVRVDPRAVPPRADESGSEIPIEADSVVLVLGSTLVGDAPLTCRLETADGSIVWTRSGLERRPEGGYTLSFAPAGLAAGSYTLRLLSDDGVELESYLLDLG